MEHENNNKKPWKNARCSSQGRPVVGVATVFWSESWCEASRRRTAIAHSLQTHSYQLARSSTSFLCFPKSPRNLFVFAKEIPTEDIAPTWNRSRSWCPRWCVWSPFSDPVSAAYETVVTDKLAILTLCIRVYLSDKWKKRTIMMIYERWETVL